MPHAITGMLYALRWSFKFGLSCSCQRFFYPLHKRLNAPIAILFTISKHTTINAKQIYTHEKTTFPFCIFFLVASSCKKDSKAVSCRLAQRVSYADSSQITYDATGRVSVCNNALGPIFTFTHSGLTAQGVVSYTGSPNTSAYQIYLNS